MRRPILFLLALWLWIPVFPRVPALAAEGGKPPESTAAAPVWRASGLPVPRFVTLRPDKVYARTGPALRYPVRWVFRKAGLPVEVIQEFDNWRKIRDRDGSEGWVHQSLLSGARGVIVKGEPGGEPLPLRHDPGENAPLVARIEPGTVARLEDCNDESWCEIKVQGFDGWIEKPLVWGIYPDEKFD